MTDTPEKEKRAPSNEVLSFLEDLEGGSGVSAPAPAASRAGLGADGAAPAWLEGVSVPAAGLRQLDFSPAVGAEAPAVEEAGKASVPAGDRIEDLSLPLAEVVAKVFEPSQRLFVIVRDDAIAYVNDAFVTMIGIPSKDAAVGQKFLTFVAREDWERLAENLSGMLTANQELVITLRLAGRRLKKMRFKAMYLENAASFMFVLVGERALTQFNMPPDFFDDITGLPTRYLLEDRAGVAINIENNKDYRLRKNKVMLLGVAINNLAGMSPEVMDSILRKVTSKLTFALKPTHTLARGIKAHLWILMPDLPPDDDLAFSAARIRAFFDEPIGGEFGEIMLDASIGASVFPNTAGSAKKLFEQGILATKKAYETRAKTVVFYKGES